MQPESIRYTIRGNLLCIPLLLIQSHSFTLCPANVNMQKKTILELKKQRSNWTDENSRKIDNSPESFLKLKSK